MYVWQLGKRLSGGFCRAGIMVKFYDLKDLFHPKLFYDSESKIGKKQKEHERDDAVIPG